MRPKTMLMRCLLLGSIVICSLFSSCDKTPIYYKFNAEWIYINNSSVDINIEGVMPFSSPEEIIIDMKQKDSYVIPHSSLAGKEFHSPAAYSLPVFTEKCKITIGSKAYSVPDGIFFRNKNNYKVDKLSARHFQFTYTFTDEVIADIVKSLCYQEVI